MQRRGVYDEAGAAAKNLVWMGEEPMKNLSKERALCFLTWPWQIFLLA